MMPLGLMDLLLGTGPESTLFHTEKVIVIVIVIVIVTVIVIVIDIIIITTIHYFSYVRNRVSSKQKRHKETGWSNYSCHINLSSQIIFTRDMP